MSQRSQGTHSRIRVGDLIPRNWEGNNEEGEFRSFMSDLHLWLQAWSNQGGNDPYQRGELVQSAQFVGVVWDLGGFGWVRPGLLPLSHFAGPCQHFKAASFGAWRAKVCFDLCRRQGFSGGPWVGYSARPHRM